jgi:putative FmdB family regulatory protein
VTSYPILGKLFSKIDSLPEAFRAMPTYEYRCPKGHHFELFQKMSDEPRAECPTCGAESDRILSGGAGFLFKGEGFYATDYRSESYKKAASKEGGRDDSGGAGGKSSGKDEKTGSGSSPTPAPGKKSEGTSGSAGGGAQGSE